MRMDFNSPAAINRHTERAEMLRASAVSGMVWA